MSNPEVRHYLISAEVPTDDWVLALQVLGRLGIDAQPVATEDLEGPDSLVLDTIEDGTIPYTLEEIVSREQYLSNEHLGEFWPKYREDREAVSGRKPSKHEALCWGINMLTHPSPKHIGYRLPPARRAEYAAQLGLKIVKPRSLVGFSDTYSGSAYGLWDHQDYGDTVVEVGSFIDYVRKLKDMRMSERPSGITLPAIRLFVALADKLEAQIDAAQPAPHE